MLFTTDKQTLDDLNIFGRHGSNSIYQIFNRTCTRGGAGILTQLFQNPLSDPEAINRRSGIIQYFADRGSEFPFSVQLFDALEPYLQQTDERTKLSAQQHSVTKKLSNLVAMDADTEAIYKGIAALVELLNALNHFLSSLELDTGHAYYADKSAMLKLLSLPDFVPVFKSARGSKLLAPEYAELDVLLRFRMRDIIRKLLTHIYELDIYLAVAKVSVERGFVFPKALPRSEHLVRLEGLYHPQVKDAVANSIEITQDRNVIFLTGANMAGKSTFMKSLSVALFLGHMGFPVAAKRMDFSVLDGIYTTINLPDNLGMGASHFYAEVLRTKKVAAELQQGKDLFVLFDEMFRGTNVKDAGEATIAFTEAFARKRNSLFVISTHIIEAGEVLKTRCENINFVYLPTLMEGNKPVYTYRLEQGLTADRHGMLIINNERILESLAEGGRVQKQYGNGTFTVDKQTLADLNLLGKHTPNSIYSLFNHTQTSGGERLLEQMFHRPLVDVKQINERSALFKYFGGLGLAFPFKKEIFAKAENYLSTGTAGNYPAAVCGLILKKLQASLLRDPQFNRIEEGLLATIDLLNACRDFVFELSRRGQVTSPFAKELEVIQALLSDSRLQRLETETKVKKLTLFKMAGFDYLLRHTLRIQLEGLMESIYHLDVYLSVSQIAKERGLAYAEALPVQENLMHTSALWHPSLVNGVANSIALNPDENMIFLTGANMAGKSTLMKAFGIAFYMAHMGFPVAAREMQFSIKDGLYSSINVHDDLTMGHSHFYAEVLRVKHVAEEVASGKRLVVIFDELFKGTNVKDAFDGTASVSAAFAKYTNCFFMVSTHIIEVGEALELQSHAIRYAYLPTVMEGNVPRYTYQLRDGITEDRQGMTIIQNEGILNMLAEPLP